VNIQDERRETETKGARTNLSFAKWDAFNIQVGVLPLDCLLERVGLRGVGLSANITLIDQFGRGATPAVALGVRLTPST
jgi:hypothetical protein